MPCSAFSAVCLRSSSIQPCSSSTMQSSLTTPPMSSAVWSSQRRTAGSLPRRATKSGRARRAYGNSTSLTKEIELVVPSMSVRMTVLPVSVMASDGLAGFIAREACGDVAAGELADPAVGHGEEADGDEAGRRPHVEPVGHAVGHADQVAALAQHFVDLAVGVQAEQAAAGNEKADLVLDV